MLVDICMYSTDLWPFVRNIGSTDGGQGCGNYSTSLCIDFLILNEENGRDFSEKHLEVVLMGEIDFLDILNGS